MTEQNINTAWIANGNAPPVTEEYIEHAAKFDFVMHAPGVWANRQGAIDRIHKANPNCKIGEYLTVNTFGPWITNEEGEDNYYGRLMAAIDGRWAITTEGDTASIWKNYPMFDFFNPEVRTAYISVVAEYAIENGIQWFMWDYFQTAYGEYRQGYPGVHGSLDLNRNGLAHKVDPEELASMYVVNMSYVKELRAALPDSVLIIPNGNLGIWYDEFSHLLDGIYVEQFPNWFFGTQAPNLENALDPEFSSDCNGPQSLWFLTEDRYVDGAGIVMLGDVVPYMPWTALTDTFPGCVSAFNNHGSPEWPEPEEEDEEAKMQVRWGEVRDIGGHDDVPGMLDEVPIGY